MSEAEYKEWVKLAGHDSDTVDLLIKQKGHADIIIYHLHQATEKLLKALLVKADKPIERTHFLDKLLAEVIIVYPNLTALEADVLAINLYLPKLRYPYGDTMELDEAIGLLNRFTAIKNKLLPLLA
jgi:HEPN domain-containing protein